MMKLGLALSLSLFPLHIPIFDYIKSPSFIPPVIHVCITRIQRPVKIGYFFHIQKISRRLIDIPERINEGRLKAKMKELADASGLNPWRLVFSGTKSIDFEHVE